MVIPNAVSGKIFVAVQEIGVRAGYDKIIASAPSMRRDKIRVDSKLLVSAIGRVQEHRAGIGK